MLDLPRAILPQSFYLQDTVTVAKALLGQVLVHRAADGLTSGKIVETEAYLARNDPANHAAKGQTPRCATMFGEPGITYVYLIYGMYHCLNVVTQSVGTPEAVLIRAIEPLEGIELMQARRGVAKLAKLANGPGRLCQAMGIHLSLNGLAMTSGSLTILRGNEPGTILSAPRVGIRVGEDLPLRFYDSESQFISTQ